MTNAREVYHEKQAIYFAGYDPMFIPFCPVNFMLYTQNKREKQNPPFVCHSPALHI